MHLAIEGTRAALAILLLTVPLTAQAIADVSAVTNDPAHPVTVRLGPGMWRMTPIDTNTGGAFDAWHPWGGVNTGCGATPGTCTQGWLWSCYAQCPGDAPMQVRRAIGSLGIPKYALASDAFALGAVNLWLPIAATTDVSLWIADSVYGDNLGGVSVRFDLITPMHPAFTADVASISLGQGGAQVFTIDGGAARANHAYFVLGSASGTAPGLASGHWHLPLNSPDPWLGFTLEQANTAFLVSTFGRLDANGRGQARLALPPGQPASIAGLRLHHAVITLDVASFSGMSTAVAVDFVR